MTVPPERKNSLIYTREFLVALLDRTKTKGVPSEIRQWAARCLRHYPYAYQIEEVAELAPHLLGPDYWYPHPERKKKE